MESVSQTVFPIIPGAGIRDTVFAIFPVIHLGAREARSIRTERYKLIRNFFPTALSEFGPDFQNVICPFVQPFDLADDPGEWNNVAEDQAYQDVRTELDRCLMQWLIEVDDPILKGPRPQSGYTEAIEDFRKAMSRQQTV